MWCPAAGCGWNGSGKFCPECGTKTVEDLPDLVVICDGKTEDGSACRAEITAGQKFCINCGKKVDQGLFGSLGDVCTGCGFALEPNHVFCPECGTKKGSQPTKPVVTEDIVKEDTKDAVIPSSEVIRQSEGEETPAHDAAVEEQLVASGDHVTGTQASISELPQDHQNDIPNEGNDTDNTAASVDYVKETESEAQSIEHNYETSVPAQATLEPQNVGNQETSDESSSNDQWEELVNQGETLNAEEYRPDNGVNSALSEELAVVHISPDKNLKSDDMTEASNPATQLDQPEEGLGTEGYDSSNNNAVTENCDTINEHSAADMDFTKDQHMEIMSDENGSEGIEDNATVAATPKEDSDESNYGTAESGSNDEDGEIFHEIVTENGVLLVENVAQKRKKSCNKKTKKRKTETSSDESDNIVDGNIGTGECQDDSFSNEAEESKADSVNDGMVEEILEEDMDTSTDTIEPDTTEHESPEVLVNEGEIVDGGQTDMDNSNRHETGNSNRHDTGNDGENNGHSSDHDSDRKKEADESDTPQSDGNTLAQPETIDDDKRLSEIPDSTENTDEVEGSRLEVDSQTAAVIVIAEDEKETWDDDVLFGDGKTRNSSKDEQSLATGGDGERDSDEKKSLPDRQESMNESEESDGSKMEIYGEIEDASSNVNAQEEEKSDQTFVFGDGKNLNAAKTNKNLVTPSQQINIFELNKTDDRQLKDDKEKTESAMTEEPRKSDEIVISSNDEDETGENSDDGTNVDEGLSRRQRKNRKSRATKTTEKDPKGEQPDSKASKSVKKNKKEQDEKNKKVSGETRTAPGTKASAMGNRNDRNVAVHFHVLVSEDFKFDPAHDRLELRIGIGKGWNDTDKVLKYHRTVAENVFEMGFDMQIPFSLLNSSRRIEYKYAIQKAGKDEFKWEHYLREKAHGPKVNRVLFLPKPYKNTDVWHQFDGFVEKIPTGIDRFFDWFSWKKDLLKHAKMATEIFSENILMLKQKGHTAQEIFEMMDMLYFGARKVYFTDARCWTSHGGESSKEMECFALDCILDRANQVPKGEANETPEQTEHRLTVALAAAHVSMKFKDLKVDDKVYPRLCKALLIKPSKAEDKCMVVEFAKKNIQSSELFLNTLLTIAKAVAKTTKDPSWLYLMPWIHLLSGDCQPFQKPEVDLKHDNIIPKWWGVAKIRDELDYFKGKSGNWSIPLQEVLKELAPLFEMDYYLPRTFVAALSLKQLKGVIQSKVIPVEVCLAALIYQLKTYTPEPSWSVYYRCDTFPYPSIDENEVLDCVKVLVEQLQEPSFSENCSVVQMKMAYKFSTQLLQQATKADRNFTLQFSVQAFIHCVAMYDRTLESDMEEEKGSKSVDHIASMKTCIQRLFRWTECYCWNFEHYLENNLKVWNGLFAPVILQSDSIRDLWNKELENYLSNCLKTKLFSSGLMMKNFVQLYCKQMDEFNIYMQDCLSKAAFNAISEGYTVDYGKFTETENRRFGNLLSNFFMVEWKKYVNTGRGSEDDRILNHVLRWPPLAQFLKIYYTDQNKLALLSEDCTTHLVQAVSAIQSRVTAITNSSISIGELRAILQQREKFVELAGLVKQDSIVTGEYVAKALTLRDMDIKAFSEQSEKMVILTNLCQYLQGVDTSAVDAVLTKQGTIEVYEVGDFCKPVDTTKVAEVEKYTPFVTAFKMSDPVLQMLPALCDCNASSTFIKFWENQCRNAECASLDDVVQNVWVPVKQRWDVFAKQVMTGQIRFEEFERVIGRTYTDEYTKMEQELKALKVSERVIRERIEQLKKYRQLATCVQGAKVVLSFAKEYELTGDFSPIRDIAQYDQKDFQMGSFDDSLMKTCAFLEGLTDDRATCLKTFVNCGPLVTWLKTSMKKSGLRELKVFVDLAFMSAGDDTMNIARVQCLHSAVTGYAPLIFDLQQTAGYKELLQVCDVVWKELDANANLPQKLRDTTNHLEWLKEIEKAHGSVEVTSLVQSDAINSGGVYTVGRGARKQTRNKTPIGIDSDPSESLRLTVAEAGKQQRNYTFTQLQDLQSRLMLVAGRAEKGNDGVEMFTMIYDSVKRLANVYMRLCCSGCVLFRDWTATFICDRKRPVCTILEFGQGEDMPTLKGRRNRKEDLGEMIPQLAKFMESCHEDWLKYIKRKRREYINLNYFTVDQLVILQREIVKLGTKDQPSHLIYPLLSAVKADCSTEDLVEAMKAAQEELDREDMETVDEGEDGEPEDDMDQVEDEGTIKQRLVQELVDAGYERRLAQRAVEHVGIGPDAETDCFLWCMNHGDDMDDDTDVDEALGKPQVQEKEELAFKGWSSCGSSIQSMITSNLTDLVHASQNDNGVKPLLNNLRTLWEKFLGSISSNVQDYLSLEHLGMILGHLAQRDSRRIERQLPPGFQEGSPNLIVCPSGDVLTTALSIYMLERDQPFPQPDEVLMCTAHTTIDEVDIFWRRAIFDGGRKIHCLLDADQLDFNVSEMAERCLEEYIQETNQSEPSYRLIVICGTDNEYRSRIVAFLDKHHRPGLPINQLALREYIANKLQVREMVNDVRTAASVDDKRSSARLVKSTRAGVGKTLYKQRREQALTEISGDEMNCVSLPLQEKHIDLHYFIQRLLEYTAPQNQPRARIFHIDIAHEVEEGVDYLLFNLLVLGCLTDRSGYVWRKLPTDLYLIETMPLMMAAQRGGDLQYVHPMLSILPDMTCRSPQESLDVYSGTRPPGYMEGDQLFDKDQFESPVFQRPFQYLYRLDQGRQLDDIQPYEAEGEPGDCLKTLLRHCGVQDPSWAELHHFVWFLDTQLQGFEQNSFVSAAAAEDLPGFGKFVLRFLIQMSRDFSTRSLNMSEESPGMPAGAERMIEGEEDGNDGGDDDLERYQMRRTWESSPHPYLFFNQDKFTFTFLGFYIDRATGNLIDQQTGAVLEQGIMAQNLYDSLVRNHAPMQENFDTLPRDRKIEKLCKVMGNNLPYDPDDSYELTTDNVKKMMAIYMRFRCDIPVIIMGETGCGKTRLVKFMCALQIPPGLAVTNMILMKVHGGTTNADIKRKVEEAERAAQQNIQAYGEHMYTVLFFDEANTTEAIGLIKEIMCDKSMEGRKLKLCKNLKMVAACNPYRKHSDELIKKLEQAGLGYHVDADETTDKLGRVPMRRLVYRVQPLPQSLLPLVWDFGQLNTNVEDLYIRQMVRRYVRADELPDIPGLVEVVSAILTASQDYMRQQQDECSFVSLRDVDRVLRVMSWFYAQSQGQRTLYDKMDDELYGDIVDSDDDEQNEDDEGLEAMDTEGQLDDVTRSLVLALGVCYHACLKDRPQYRDDIAQHFRAPCRLYNGGDQIEKEISCCQEVFLDNVQLEKNIARNMALKENIFMMVVCIELRLPLFLVGKPGSSKSLAKTIVSDAMQGNASREILFKELKQAQMVSFQCSPLSTPDGIVGTFRQCAQFQKDKDLNNFVSIVVLDEVGLAEDSPRMPLKTLHPLLEDGCQGDEKPEAHLKVAFVGISNWALDPAKMNRGILVQREVPDLTELKNSATGICDTTHKVKNRIKPLITPMSVSYLEIFEKASTSMREFFGLRDFYSLVKMVYAFAEKSKKKPTWYEMVHAIKRNFGGLDQVDPVEFFKENLATTIHIDEQPRKGDPDCSAAGLIQACLVNTKSESRYLLLLTENYGALTILQQQILSSDIRPITIFGSSFRSDQEYTQVCRNINKIKVCMETGNTVVLLNLENLYESLYDALNQYYVYFGGERYVDLGLGTHRVKCPVHKNFRLIVVAEKQTVYKKFPIPLINRLEKHFLTINTMLSPEQLRLVKQLENWARQFVSQTGPLHRHRGHSSKAGDAFMGYHDDTCSAIILHVWPKLGQEDDDQEQLLQEAKAILLWCATPAAVVRVEQSALPPQEKRTLQQQYFKRQRHGSIAEYLHFKLVEEGCKQLYAQVTTHSKLLVSGHRRELAQATGISHDKIMLLDTLSSFDTEQQFSNKIQQHMQKDFPSPSLLVIQCDSGDTNANLVACARYCVMDEYLKVSAERRASVHIVFIVQLPNIAGGCFTGFQCGIWHSAHIDDLWTTDVDLPSIQEMQTKSVSRLVSDAVQTAVPMETEEGHAGDERDWEGEEMWGEREPAHGGSMYGEEPIPADGAAAMHRPHEADVENQPQGSAVGLEDVMQMAGMPLDRHPEGGNRRHLNVQKLILSCVQAALSMLKDKEESSARTTDRVALLLKLFHQDSTIGKQFLQGVSRLIASLLKEKEDSSVMPGQWLLNEAARHEHIQKAGTFRQACIQTLESKISPILAGIIAHLDTNQNLDILQQQQLPWKQDVWLAILNTAGTLQLQYSDLQSPKRQSDLKEVVVRTTGCEGHVFKGQMPFSWLIYQQISTVLKNPQPGHEEEKSVAETVEFFVTVLVETQLGKLLWEMRDHTVVEEILQAYLGDLVHFVYLVQSDRDHEYQLVCQTIEYKASLEPTEGTLLHRLVMFHMSHHALAPRLTYFRAMNSVWPECSNTIVNLKRENPDHYMFKEEEFTFSALGLLIENLAPQAKDLNLLPGRTAWLARVHQMRSVIEKVLSLHAEDPQLYGGHSARSVQRARCMWTRVLVIKLFLEHVCIAEQEDNITVRHCLPLWKMLGEEANMKEGGTFIKIEKFLKSCNRTAIKEFLGKAESCSHCESVLEGPPIVLPCKEVLCDKCFHDMLARQGDNRCPKCKAHVPENWNPERQVVKKGGRQKLKNYQKRCNSFFMDLVSQLCFADNTPPSQEVVDQLFGYITCSTKNAQRLTKEISVFETGVDPNPVFRSFLLQLLMRTCEEHVTDNLERYIRHAFEFFHKDNEMQGELRQLCVLVVQCLEDIFEQQVNKVDVNQVTFATRCLQNARETVNIDDTNVGKLTGLAETRFGMSVAARCLDDISKGKATPDVKIRRLVEAAQVLCEEGRSKWPKIYLVKVLCRRYGVDLYWDLCRSEAQYLRWIAMRDRNLNEQVEGADRYIVCGEAYTQIREALTKVVLGEDVQHLDQILQGLHTAGGHIETLLQLAMHREVACSQLYPVQQRRVTDNVLAVMTKYAQKSDILKNKNLATAVLQNALGRRCPHLTITPAEDLRHQGLQCLLVHFLCAISPLQGDKTLLEPLIMLMKNPQNCFLPTMPQDDLEDVRDALLAARPADGGENPFFYRCPNGHPYVIGNCGRPASVGRCNKCGEEIGGEGYRLRPGNTQLQAGGDQTLMGHILGRVEARGQGPVPERSLTPAYCACLRLFIHLAMYLGAAENPQAIAAVITPDIMAAHVPEFLWAHLQQDLEDVQRGLGKSVDDVLVLAHVIINNIMRQHRAGGRLPAEVCKLNSKNGRLVWEKKFSDTYLVPVVQAVDTTLKEMNQQLAQDNRLGADPLLCLMYEIDNQTQEVDGGPLQDVAEVWRYRTPVSLTHLRQEFEAQVAGQKGKPKHTVLQQFLKEDHHLRAMRFIPSIFRLHRALFFKYQRKLDKAEASNITVGQLRTGEETDTLIRDFTEAWELVRADLRQYLCPTEVGGMIVPKEYCSQPITDRTPISLLLPTTKEAGLCSLAMLDFLMRKQNGFLEGYQKVTKRKLDSVPAREITSAHLISYDPQHDILPLVLANCQYSFEMGKGTKIEYDFAGLERQLMDRFLFSKSRIDVGRVIQIDQMIYRTEFTNAVVFKSLAEKIPQVGLNSAVKSQILAEIRSLPELCQSLDNLDISISFLKSIGGQPQHSLADFMENTLRMEVSLYSHKAKQICQFQHTQSLWMLLSLQKSKQLAEHRQPRESIFESVTAEFMEDLPDDVTAEFVAYMRQLSVEKLTQLVEVLHEYIILVVAVRENRDDEDYMDTTNQKLREWLYEYVDSQDQPPIDTQVLLEIPATILYRHSVDAWVTAYRTLLEKRTGQRRF